MQVMTAIAALSVAGWLLFELPAAVAFIAGSGFVLSSTAVIASVLQERGETSTSEGQKSIAILLFEDLMIVPLLATIAFLAPLPRSGSHWSEIPLALGALLLLLGVARWGLNPFFALLARARTREVLTAGALLVILGSALLMDLSLLHI